MVGNSKLNSKLNQITETKLGSFRCIKITLHPSHPKQKLQLNTHREWFDSLHLQKSYSPGPSQKLSLSNCGVAFLGSDVLKEL